MQRLVGDDLTLTQEFLAQMMGVQRSGVNAIAQELQELAAKRRASLGQRAIPRGAGIR
jgi:hypothetical protein